MYINFMTFQGWGTCYSQISLSWISVKMSPCQPCPLIFMTSLCCFYEYLHLYPQGPSTQGTFTRSISHQGPATSLSGSCHLLHVPAIRGPFLHVGFPHPLLRIRAPAPHSPRGRGKSSLPWKSTSLFASRASDSGSIHFFF